MKISCIKYENDINNFNLFEKIGVNVYKLKNPEEVDNKISQLVKDNCKTIILSNDIASFSEDIIKKYNKKSEINIIIIPRR